MKHKVLKYLSFLFFIAYTSTSLAQKIYYVGIPTSKVDYCASSQEKPQWCWAASIQMVLNYYDIAITQEQIVERTYGKDFYGDLPNWAASLETIHMNLNNWAVDNEGKKYIVNAQFGVGPPEPVFLIEELSRQRPVIIGFQSNYGGHAVVVTAISYFQTMRGPVIRSIIVRDPMPTTQNRMNKGRVEYEAGTLANRILAHWYVNVFSSGY